MTRTPDLLFLEAKRLATILHFVVNITTILNKGEHNQNQELQGMPRAIDKAMKEDQKDVSFRKQFRIYAIIILLCMLK